MLVKCIVNFIFKKNKDEYDKYLEQVESLVSSLPWSYIKSFLLEEIASKPEKFRIIMFGCEYPSDLVEDLELPIKSGNFKTNLLSEANADFFSTFSYFTIVNSDFSTDISYVEISEFEPHYVRLGYDYSYELVSEKNNDVVFLLEWNSKGEIDEPYLEYTIWHYVLDTLLILNPDIYEDLIRKSKQR